MSYKRRSDSKILLESEFVNNKTDFERRRLKSGKY